MVFAFGVNVAAVVNVATVVGVAVAVVEHLD
jgi:hypothetical protein